MANGEQQRAKDRADLPAVQKTRTRVRFCASARGLDSTVTAVHKTANTLLQSSRLIHTHSCGWLMPFQGRLLTT